MSTYYLDARQGRDTHDGQGEDRAFQTLSALSDLTLSPGDRVLLRRGCRFVGTLAPRGQGAPGSPITIGAYGEGPLPIVDGQGGSAAILLSGQSHFILEHLHAQNPAPERAVRRGIAVLGSGEGIVRDITIRGCEVSNVHGENRRALPAYQNMYWNGGIYAGMPGRSTERAHLEDLLIEGNHIHDVTTSGIRVAQQEDFVVDIHHRNVVVRSNRIERTGTDGIIVANCVAPLIEGNTCYDAGALGNLTDTQLIAGVWVCSVSDAIIRRNEVARTRLFENDGTAFDTDWGVSGTILFEENYTHDNRGGFWLDCASIKRNPAYVKTLLRGNVSVNDRRAVTQADSGLLAELTDNLFVQTENAVEICTQAEGLSHRYQGNTFAYPKAPLRGWQSVNLNHNRWLPAPARPAPELRDGFAERERWLAWAKEA